MIGNPPEPLSLLSVKSRLHHIRLKSVVMSLDWKVEALLHGVTGTV